jgi:ribosomal protein S18 acetylase RimI-like enzyme
MNEPPVIRAASVGDIEQLSSTGSKAFLDTYGNVGSEPDIEEHVYAHFSPAAISAEMQRPDVQYFLATTTSGCLGLLKLRDATAPAEIDVETTLQIEQIYVSSEHQRQGVGILLMDRAVRVARDRGADGIWLSVWSEADRAIAFYRRYGFTKHGTVPFYLGTTQQVDYVMWLPTPLS